VKSGQKTTVISGWVCTSHTEIIWDAPGKCPRCGLELEPGTLPVAETRPAPQSARRWFLKMGLAFLSGLIWLACHPASDLWNSEAYGMGYGGDSDYDMMEGMMGGGA